MFLLAVQRNTVGVWMTLNICTCDKMLTDKKMSKAIAVNHHKILSPPVQSLKRASLKKNITPKDIHEINLQNFTHKSIFLIY